VDIARILIQLKAQRNQLDTAIAALEAISPNPRKSSQARSRRSRRGTKSRRKTGVRSSRPGAQAMGKLIPFRRTRRGAALKPFQVQVPGAG
jgi:hypothetical protein